MAELYLDEDVDLLFGPFLVAKGHATLTTQEIGQLRAQDDTQLLTATDLGRLLITHNRRDFLLLARAWRSLAARWGVDPGAHAGIIVIPQRMELPLAQAAEEIDILIRREANLWGKVFNYDRNRGWIAEL